MLRAAVAAFAALVGAAASQAQDRENCLYCHQFTGLSRFDTATNRVHLYYVDPGYVHSLRGPHARLACTDCHPREEVSVVPHHETTPVDCTRQCHLVSPNGPERRFSHENIARMLAQSVHTSDALSKLEFTGGPLLDAAQSQCLYCHDEPVFRNTGVMASIHNSNDRLFDRCDVCHASQLPLDTRYALRHVTSRLQTARPTLELAQVCAVCHSDPKFLTTHEVGNSVASYVGSFHGKAALLGETDTANCLSCHIRARENVHLMLGPNDQASAVHVSRVADSCRTTDCHPGADPGFSAAAVHLDLTAASGTVEYVLAIAFILLTIFSFGPSAVIVLLELAQLVIGRYYHATEEIERVAEELMRHPDGHRRLQRFAPRYRIQHWILTVLFIFLCATGFPLKFADHAWAEATVQLFGGLTMARLVHHWTGVALVLGFIAHLGDIMLGIIRRARERDGHGRPHGVVRAFWGMPFVITPTDARKAGELLAYLTGLRRTRPMFGRFTITEKFEYFGVAWGTSLLGLTGLMLWGEQLASHIFGGRLFNIALIIHTYEAFLAAIHVGILHIYNVVLNPAVFPMSMATLSGYTPATKLAEENGEFVLEVAQELGMLRAEAAGE